MNKKYLRFGRDHFNDYMRFGRDPQPQNEVTGSNALAAFGNEDEMDSISHHEAEPGQRSGSVNPDDELEDDQEEVVPMIRQGRVARDPFLRFGRAATPYLRFGRDVPYLRFGRDVPYLRFGREVPYLRFGKRNVSYMRFGRNQFADHFSGVEKSGETIERPGLDFEILPGTPSLDESADRKKRSVDGQAERTKQTARTRGSVSDLESQKKIAEGTKYRVARAGNAYMRFGKKSHADNVRNRKNELFMKEVEKRNHEYMRFGRA